MTFLLGTPVSTFAWPLLPPGRFCVGPQVPICFNRVQGRSCRTAASPRMRGLAHDPFANVASSVTIKPKYVNMADINVTTLWPTPAEAESGQAGGEPIW